MHTRDGLLTPEQCSSSPSVLSLSFSYKHQLILLTRSQELTKYTLSRDQARLCHLAYLCHQLNCLLGQMKRRLLLITLQTVVHSKSSYHEVNKTKIMANWWSSFERLSQDHKKQCNKLKFSQWATRPFVSITIDVIAVVGYSGYLIELTLYLRHPALNYGPKMYPLKWLNTRNFKK